MTGQQVELSRKLKTYILSVFFVNILLEKKIKNNHKIKRLIIIDFIANIVKRCFFKILFIFSPNWFRYFGSLETKVKKETLKNCLENDVNFKNQFVFKEI